MQTKSYLSSPIKTMHQTVVSYFKSFLKIFLSFVFTRCMPHMKTLPPISPYTQVEGGQRQMSHACNEFRSAFKSREMSHQVFLATDNNTLNSTR